jgi:hypothetical protein
LKGSRSRACQFVQLPVRLPRMVSMRNRACMRTVRSVRRTKRGGPFFELQAEESEMAHKKQASSRKRGKEAVPMVGMVGVSLSLAGGASAATAVTTTDVPLWDTGAPPQIALSEEEIADVSLGTFYVFDKETAGTPLLGTQIARGCGCHGCRGCGGCRGCRGCGRGCRGCGCGGCGCGGCGCCWIWGVCRVC